jgi:RNA polymerase sigma-70 factor (ECF subfamily)
VTVPISADVGYTGNSDCTFKRPGRRRLVKRSLKSWQIYVEYRESVETRERLFRSIWNVYRKRLMYFIRNYTGDDSEDIFQEIMLKVFQNMEKFNHLYSFNTLIYTIARNHCLNHLNKRKLAMVAGDPETSAITPESTLQENEVIRKELHLEIDRVMATFSRANREIAFLRLHEGMKHREIARVMNIPTGTVKSRLHQIRLLLRKAVEAYHER